MRVGVEVEVEVEVANPLQIMCVHKQKAGRGGLTSATGPSLT